VPLIFEEAPIGTYYIDELLDELLAFGFTPSDPVKLIARIRLEIYFAENSKITIDLKAILAIVILLLSTL
jgi:hypothetical protein